MAMVGVPDLAHYDSGDTRGVSFTCETWGIIFAMTYLGLAPLRLAIVRIL